MVEGQNEGLLISRSIALATLAWYYEEQIKFIQTQNPGNISVIATVYQKKVQVLRELEKIADIPYINEHPAGGDDA